MDNSSESGSMLGDRQSSERTSDEIVEVEKLTQKENRRVFFWHKVVTSMMIVAAVIISATSYKILYRENSDDFLTAYNLFAESVRDSTSINIKATVNAAKTFSAATSTYAKAMNSVWPFVTVPDFEVQVANVKNSTRAERVLLSPIVDVMDYDEWNRYVQANIGWREESLASYGRSENFSEPIAPMFAVVRGENIAANEWRPAGPYLPYWQSSPPVPRSATNRDRFTFFGNVAYGNAMNASRDCLFGSMFDVDYYVGDDKDFSFEHHDDRHSAFTSYRPDQVDRDIGWAVDVPHSNLVCPVFEKENDRSSKIVGMYSFILPWDAFLSNLLPRGSQDLMVVLSNTKNQTASFILRGNNALMIGWEDAHDDKYDSMAVSFDMTALVGFRKEDYEGVESSGALFYDVVVYPTSSFENQYKNNTPFVFTSVIVIAFFSLILTFLTYDYVVHRRNRKVVYTAARSNAIVTSLFPSTVRDRLFEKEDEKKQQDGAPKLMQRFLQNGNLQGEFGDTDDDDDHSSPCTKPIADNFPETTIMFADIAGFTAWSSNRDPVAVFTLLEAIYNAFDKMAKRLGVFKVETIGDCYLAVCGLPTARKDHAVVMARFAAKCCDILPVITHDLQEALGTDTACLTMRIGLHSGSVTAGVLRGERSRFQLFGDSVNTAARMESTGVKGKIQISEATAQLLREAGRIAWFEEREDTVQAKGKGAMKTYFLVKASTRTARLSMDTSTCDTLMDQSASSNGELKGDDLNFDQEAVELDLEAANDWEGSQFSC